MKHFIYILALLVPAFLFSCSASKNTTETTLTKSKFTVEGICGMCEERIENALSVRGIKTAEWNVDSKLLTVIYAPEKINQERIEELLADAGHDTPNKKASLEAYDALNGCCKYRNGGTCDEE